MAQLRALARRGAKDLCFVSWGGGLPLELLLAAGAVSRAIFCFSSLDLFGLAPRSREAMETGMLPTEEMTALAFIKGLEAAGQGMKAELMQLPAGSEVFPGREPPLTGLPTGGGAPLVMVPAVEIDVLLLHAQRADEAGNVELSGARGLDLSQVFAAGRVLVTVEARVPEGTLPAPGACVVPRSFVTALAEAPGGARPTSCLPYYGTDFRWLQKLAQPSAGTPVDHLWAEPPKYSGPTVVMAVAERQISLTEATSVLTKAARPAPAPVQGERAGGYSVDELMTCILARQVGNDSRCSVGSSSPLATAAYFLAKTTHAPAACIITHNGCYVDVAPRPMCLWAAEALDYASCSAFSGGAETYHQYYQRGLVTHEIVSAAQVDKTGATNNVRINRPDGGFTRLPGQGGMADVANLHVNFALYLTRHSPRSLVRKVDFVSAARGWSSQERQRYGLAPGEVTLVTNLGQFRYDERHGQLVLTHVHPGVSTEDVAVATGFALVISPQLAESSAPSERELEVLRHQVDPLGLRRLEFVASRHRQALIEELLVGEEEALSHLPGRTRGP